MKNDQIFFIGTYSDSIHMLRLHDDTGTTERLHTIKGLNKPSYQAISKDNTRLYSVNETDGQGGVCVFRLDGDKKPELMNKRPSQGPGACHIKLSDCEKFLLAAGYADGTVTVYPIDSDGSICAFTQVRKHKGKSVHPTRQTAPHAHYITPMTDTNFVYATDLGTDRIMQYVLKDGLLHTHDLPFVKIHNGAGPRHLTFDRVNRFAYCVNELDNTISVLSVDQNTGVLTVIQTIETLPDAYDEPSTSAAVKITQDGRFVYSSNRGHDSIAIFSCDRMNGRLQKQGHIRKCIHEPRDFGIDPTDRYLIIANQNDHNLHCMKRNLETGEAETTQITESIEKPVCVSFLHKHS